MMKDTEIIHVLEQELRVSLPQLEDAQWFSRGYQIDTHHHVIGLYLYHVGLKEFPHIITQLTTLTSLAVSNNQLSTLPEAITQLTALTSLNVSYNHLSTLPEAITQLTTLTSLNVSGNHLSTLSEAITQLTALTELYVMGNQLSTLPEAITQLPALTSLDVSGNHLSTLPEAITQLPALTSLDVSGTELRTLPEAITQLTNLTTLHVCNNHLSPLPEAITQLPALTLLNVSNNQLRTLPEAITQLPALTSLNVSNNQLRTLPEAITQLPALTSLDVSYNHLSPLPEVITQLPTLTSLNVSGNQLRTLPEAIGQLTALTGLYVSNNQLRTLPEAIGQLTALTLLDVMGNQLRTLPEAITQLTALTSLDVSHNQLSTLPRELLRLKKLRFLNVRNNPLKQPPPEIAKQGFDAIFEYLRHLPGQVVNETKLLLVGQGDVGKTCLAKRLIFDTFQHEKSTEGIDILQWDIPASVQEQQKIHLNVWDFGGQEIYHATHQFFLTKRSVYLLVWNARKTKDYEHIYYWLHTIEAFGEESPIILVLTKVNERDDDLNLKDIKEQFPQVVGLYKVDNEDARGIPALTNIIKKITWNLPHMQTVWIASWFKVRERLEQDKRAWIEYTEFQRICQQEGLDAKQAAILDEYLHNLGVIIHFQDRVELGNMMILNPEWATKAVYTILDTQSVRNRGGILMHSELEEIWNPTMYPVKIYSQLLELMNKFELAYELPDKQSHLVAELLPSTEPDFDWDETDNLRFYYRYSFLPAGVITRFIVLIHQDLELLPNGRHRCWREGAVLSREGTRAVVKKRGVEKVIEIRITGSKKRELLAIMRYHFDHIHRSIKKITITEEIPCNCSHTCTHRFNYQQLLKAEKRGKATLDCYVTLKEVSVSSLLDGYERKEQRMKDRDELYNLRSISINAKGDVTINAGGDVVGGNKTGGDIIKAEVKGNHQQVAIGKNIQQQSREILKGGTIDMGDTIKGDQINVSGGTVERIETGDKFYDQAQQLIQTVNAQSSQEDIVKVLAAIQEGLTKLELPEAVKEEALNEVKGAEIQVKKEKPDKPKLVERLKNAQDALTGMENLGMKAVAIGNLLVKVIEWAEQLLR